MPNVFSIGNSLTNDACAATNLSGTSITWHVDSARTLKYIYDHPAEVEIGVAWNNASTGLGSSVVWDFLVLQPYTGSTLDEDIEYAGLFINAARDTSPNVKVVIHPGWCTSANHETYYTAALSSPAGSSTMYASIAYIDALLAGLRADYPSTEFRCTNTHWMWDKFRELYATSPFYNASYAWNEYPDETSLLYRDNGHASFVGGRAIAHNALRLCLGSNWETYYNVGDIRLGLLTSEQRDWIKNSIVKPGLLAGGLSLPDTPVFRLRCNEQSFAQYDPVHDASGNAYHCRFNTTGFSSVERVAASDGIQFPSPRSSGTCILETSTTSPKLEFESGDEYSIMFWAKLPDNANATEQIQIKSSSGAGFNVQWKPSSYRVNFMTYSGASYPTSYRSSMSGYCGAWHHYAITVNSDGEATFYIDGDIPSGTRGWTGVADHTVISRSSNAKVGIGGGTVTDGQTFTGQLDDFRIYNRALTETEIESVMLAKDTSSGTPIYQLINSTINHPINY